MAFIKFLFSKKILVVINGILISIAVILNVFIQVFCIPSFWAIILLIICFANTVFFPLTKRYEKLLPFLSFINGVSLCLFIYCILFLEHMNLLGLITIIFGVGLVVFIPHFFAIQLLWMNIYKPVKKSVRYFFLSGVFVCMGISLFIGLEYKKALEQMNDFVKSDYQVLEKNFMTEKILGMHFIYHTRFCEYDGWRPPIHEPILIIGMWLNNRYDPLNITLKRRVELYKRFFPENQIKFNCSCAINYSENYHNDSLLK